MSEKQIEKKIKECNMCEPRHCVALRLGRLINDNERGAYPIDPAKIKTTHISIEECGVRKDLLSGDKGPVVI